MNEPQSKELPVLYKNYLKTCRLLELVGGVILIGTILLNEFLHLEVHGFVIPAALRAAKTVRLTPRHHAIVTAAVEGYSAAPDSDPELAAQLSAAAEQYVKKGFLP